MPRCACASEVYGSVFVCLFVCLSVCVDCYSCSMINELSFYRHLVTFSWILTRGFAK